MTKAPAKRVNPHLAEKWEDETGLAAANMEFETTRSTSFLQRAGKLGEADARRLAEAEVALTAAAAKLERSRAKVAEWDRSEAMRCRERDARLNAELPPARGALVTASAEVRAALDALVDAIPRLEGAETQYRELAKLGADLPDDSPLRQLISEREFGGLSAGLVRAVGHFLKLHQMAA